MKARLDYDDLTVLAYRFKGDRICTAQRFAAYREALGDRFRGHELPDDPNPDVPRSSQPTSPTPTASSQFTW
nr:hypothetical protein GCM10017745_43960 [Saccharothrix mutabilis subsp. capreolus]